MPLSAGSGVLDSSCRHLESLHKQTPCYGCIGQIFGVCFMVQASFENTFEGKFFCCWHCIASTKFPSLFFQCQKWTRVPSLLVSSVHSSLVPLQQKTLSRGMWLRLVGEWSGVLHCCNDPVCMLSISWYGVLSPGSQTFLDRNLYIVSLVSTVTRRSLQK